MMTEPPTDAAAILASRDEPGSFVAVFDRHYTAIHTYLRRRLGEDLADDLASETFLRAFEARRRYDSSRPDARPWLYGIATNLVRRHRRDELRQLLAYSRMGIDPTADPDQLDAVEGRIDAHRARLKIALALFSLRPVEREVLLLFAWAELSYQEISVACDLPVGTVRSRLFRARARLRELLSPIGQYRGAGDAPTESVQEEAHDG